MASHPAKKASKKRPRRKRVRGLRAIEVEVKKSPKTTLRDIELAIRKGLASQPTELFRSEDKLIIVIEKFGVAPPRVS